MIRRALANQKRDVSMKRGFFKGHSCRRAFSAVLLILFFLGLAPAQAGTKPPKKPANDDFEHRAKLGKSAKFDNSLATFQDGEPSDNDYIGYSTSEHSLWWTWTAPRDGQVVISVDSDFRFYLGAYSGNSLSNLTPVQKRNNQPLVVTVAANTELQISLDGDGTVGTQYGTGKVIVKFIPTAANDNFARSQTISGVQVVIQGNNTAATQEPGELNSPFNTLNHTVWFKWIAPETGYAVLVPAAGLSHLVAGVYTGSSVSNLTTEVTSNPGAAVGFSTIARKTYYIAVDGAFGWQGPFSLALSLSTIHLTRPANGALFYEGDPIQIAAAVSPLDGDGTTIDYYAGGQLLGSRPRNGALVWNNAPLGDYSLRAVITDSHNFSRISGPVNIRVRPPNDDFTNAFVLQGLNVTTNGINAGAGKEAGEPTGGNPNADGSVWYTWTAPASGEVWVSIGENYFSGHPLGVYTGDSVSNLVALAESIYDFYPCHFVAHTGDKVHIEVSGFSQQIPDGFGPFTLTVDQRVAPANDDFNNRMVLSGISAQGSGTLSNATVEPGEPNSSPSVWWSWTAPETGTLFLNATSDTLGANFNFYTGDSITNLQFVGGIGPTWYNATGASGQIQALQGVTYQIMLTGSYTHPNGSVSFDMELAQAVPNDNFANAYPLAGLVAVGYSSNTIATVEPGETPVVSQARRASPSCFTFTFAGKRGTTYTVLTSTNLFSPISEWQPILTTNLWEDSATIQDDTASDAQRYYRVKVGP
jgi:hypothetical protein